MEILIRTELRVSGALRSQLSEHRQNRNSYLSVNGAAVNGKQLSVVTHSHCLLRVSQPGEGEGLSLYLCTVSASDLAAATAHS